MVKRIEIIGGREGEGESLQNRNNLHCLSLTQKVTSAPMNHAENYRSIKMKYFQIVFPNIKMHYLEHHKS
jgi:hypothetical protein